MIKNELTSWESNLERMSTNVARFVREFKKHGICSMSRATLRQNVDTKDIHVPPAAFDRLLDDAIVRANVGKLIY